MAHLCTRSSITDSVYSSLQVLPTLQSVKAYASGDFTFHICAKSSQRDVLGPYAFERQMPTWQKLLIKHQSGTFVGLQYGPEPEIPLLVMSNETHNTIRVLQMLSDADPSVRR